MIKNMPPFLLVLLLIPLFLAGCDATRGLREYYTKEEAREELKAGSGKMEKWIRENCPSGKALSMENCFWELPNGPVFLSGYLEGEFTDSRKNYDYLLNVDDGELYLEPGAKQRTAFYRECRDLVGECLGIDEFILDKDEYSDTLSFMLSMGLDQKDEASDPEEGTDSSLKEGAENSFLDGEYSRMRLPALLVISGEDPGDYVREFSRKDRIFVRINAYVPEGTDLSGYSIEEIQDMEKRYALHFDWLTLHTDSAMMTIEKNADGREVVYTEKEE